MLYNYENSIKKLKQGANSIYTFSSLTTLTFHRPLSILFSGTSNVCTYPTFIICPLSLHITLSIAIWTSSVPHCLLCYSIDYSCSLRKKKKVKMQLIKKQNCRPTRYSSVFFISVQVLPAINLYCL